MLNTKTLIIDDLRKLITTISSIHCEFLTENCITLLENNGHQSGCSLSVSGDTQTEFDLQWKKEINKNSYKEPAKVAEHAAEAISFFLSAKLTDYTIIEEALIGMGFDYWLGYDENHQFYNPDNFMKARLEISGIEKETKTNNLDRRIKEKKEQTRKSDYTMLPAYISIVEFSSPKAFFGIR